MVKELPIFLTCIDYSEIKKLLFLLVLFMLPNFVYILTSFVLLSIRLNLLHTGLSIVTVHNGQQV
jgi:flagellar biosynthesis protein FliP